MRRRRYPILAALPAAPAATSTVDWPAAREIAVVVGCDPRTVMARVRGKPTRPGNGRRIDLELQRRGLLDAAIEGGDSALSDLLDEVIQ